MEKRHKTYAEIRNIPPRWPTVLSFFSSNASIYESVLNKNGLNKVQSDFRLWDLQINPAWVPWGPGSGINCYISWPSSCCLSQPAWLGSGLARNHGLRTQQYGHFPRQKTRASGGLLSKQDEQCQTLLAPTFHNHFFYCHFSLFAPADPWRFERLADSSGSRETQKHRKTEHWPFLYAQKSFSSHYNLYVQSFFSFIKDMFKDVLLCVLKTGMKDLYFGGNSITGSMYFLPE